MGAQAVLAHVVLSCSDQLRRAAALQMGDTARGNPGLYVELSGGDGAPSVRVARHAVTNAEFAVFVNAGSHAERELWSAEGWQWLTEGCGGALPERSPGLDPNAPAVPITAFEAEAYCTWLGARVASAAEVARVSTDATGGGFHAALSGCVRRCLLVSPRTPRTGNRTTADRLAAILARAGRVVVRDPRELPSAEMALAQLVPDVVVAIHAMKCGAVLDACAALSGAPRVVLVLGGTDANVDAVSSPEAGAVFRRRCAAADAVVSFTPALAVDVGQAVRVIPQGVVPPPPLTTSEVAYTEAIFRDISLDGRRRVLLLVAGLRPVKDVLFLADAAEAAWGMEGGRYRLVILGPDLDAAYAAAVAARVVSTPEARRALALVRGGVSQAVALALTMRSAAVVNSSTSENNSAALVDALAAGKPVLARDVPGNRDALALVAEAAAAVGVAAAGSAFAGAGFEAACEAGVVALTEGEARAWTQLIEELLPAAVCSA
eukprot:NODE_2837_length_2135_cov_181.575199.p1 GENE.NODE_2837_length_2135_cov_181.575199~~NODE_2837_length_2135_cov_181.575199.p1  ORF type:complete len:491 (+),score=177.14 NODE_2837_length_2135_cov_181.575199:63-1535(+)